MRKAILHRTALVILLIAIIMGAMPAYAHKIKIFAAIEGDTVTGFVYAPGGKRLSGVEVRAANSDGAEVFNGKTDDKGVFRFQNASHESLTLQTDLGDGHMARFSLGAPPKAQTQTVQTAQTVGSVSAEALQRLIDVAVERNVNPLREEIALMKDDIRFRDILTGLGWIAGLGGLWMMWAARRARRRD